MVQVSSLTEQCLLLAITSTMMWLAGRLFDDTESGGEAVGGSCEEDTGRFAGAPEAPEDGPEKRDRLMERRDIIVLSGERIGLGAKA